MKNNNILKKILVILPLVASLVLSNNNYLFADESESMVVDFENEDTNDVSMVTEDNSLILVSFPTELPFVIDPFELNGFGQVYSKEFRIYNNSDEDVIVSISSIYYVFKDSQGYLSLENPDGLDGLSDEKAIYLYLDNGNPDEKIVVSDVEQTYVKDYYLEALNSNDEDAENFTSFKISGNINPSAEWKDGDVQIVIDYVVTPASGEINLYHINYLDILENSNENQENTFDEWIDDEKNNEADGSEDIGIGEIEQTDNASEDFDSNETDNINQDSDSNELSETYQETETDGVESEDDGSESDGNAQN